MKKYAHISLMLFALTFLAVSCDKSKQQEDSKEEAKEENKEKFDETDLKADWEFAIAAADGGMAEVELGKLAESKGTDPQVKAFGQSMVADHGKANEELKALAQQKNISIPDSVSDKYKKKYDDLSEKSGAEFDKAYIENMIEDHEKDIDAFRKESEDGKDPELKSWAAAKLPILTHHLEMAKKAKEAFDQKDKAKK
jgi:putative membrane protein